MNRGTSGYTLLWVVAMAGCTFTWDPLYQEEITEEELRSVAIAPLDEALTFARYEVDGALHVIGVRSYEGGNVEGVDLSAALAAPGEDPIELFHRLGFEGLRSAVSEGSAVSVPVAALALPVDLRSHHVAAGVNFPEHADETGVEEGPYLFPKITSPTNARSEVAILQGLLDYEVELAWVSLDPIEEGESPENMGVILCNDFSNREVLLRHLDPDDTASGQGFTTGKSFAGYLPVGDLFVIPQDYRAFADARQLRLYVNHQLRQDTPVSRAIWDVDAILEQVWIRRDTTWEHRGQQVSLFANDDGVILDRALIMVGTPPGVVFNEVGVESRATAFLDFVFGGWGETLADHAIEDYIRDAKASGYYLMPGDEVDIHVDYLGVVRSEIVE